MSQEFLSPNVRCKHWGTSDPIQTWTSGLLFRLLSELYLIFIPALLLHFLDDLCGRKSLLGRRNFRGVIGNIPVPGGIRRNKSPAGFLQQGNGVFGFRSSKQRSITLWRSREECFTDRLSNSFTASQNCAFRFSTSFFIAAGVSDGRGAREYLMTCKKDWKLRNTRAHGLSAFWPRTDSLNSRTRTWSCESCS